MRQRRLGPRWSVQERARLAAELLEEARSLTESGEFAVAAAPATTVEAPSGNGATAAPAVARCGDEERAMARLDHQIAQAPRDADARIARAELLGARGRYAAAYQDLVTVLEDEPDHVRTLTALGALQARRGLWADAVHELRRALALAPDAFVTWCLLGEALNRQDDLCGALAAFERACALVPDFPRALQGMGRVLDRLGRSDEATPLYRRAREAAGR